MQVQGQVEVGDSERAFLSKIFLNFVPFGSVPNGIKLSGIWDGADYVAPSGLAALTGWFPGRCPGLKYSAPLGHYELKLVPFGAVLAFLHFIQKLDPLGKASRRFRRNSAVLPCKIEILSIWCAFFLS